MAAGAGSVVVAGAAGAVVAGGAAGVAGRAGVLLSGALPPHAANKARPNGNREVRLHRLFFMVDGNGFVRCGSVRVKFRIISSFKEGNAQGAALFDGLISGAGPRCACTPHGEACGAASCFIRSSFFSPVTFTCPTALNTKALIRSWSTKA